MLRAMIERAARAAELWRLRKSGLFEVFQRAAIKHGLPLAYLIAIASRETNCRNILGDYRPVQPGGRLEYHGVGVLQIDVQHQVAWQARDRGTWRTPEEMAALIDFGAALLADNLKWAEKNYPGYGNDAHRKIAASAYNTGPHNAADGVRHGDSDLHTTGRDYGRDVVARMAVFAALLDGKR